MRLIACVLDGVPNQRRQVDGIHIELCEPVGQEPCLRAVGEAPLDDDAALTTNDAQAAPPRQLFGGKLGVADGDTQEFRGAL